MSVIVEKFGGTSVGSIARIKAVAQHLRDKHSHGERLVVVVSAMSGETKRLIALAHDLATTPSPREMDVLVSTGEQRNRYLLAMALHELGLKAKSYTGAQVSIRTDDVYYRFDGSLTASD